MVYCTKCGTKNEEDAVVCVKCGESLVARPPWTRARRRAAEEECFGIPHGGAVAGLVFGIIIILAGFIWVLQAAHVIPSGVELLWPFIVIIFGILVLVGALYRFGRRY